MLELFLYAVREVGAREKLAQRYDGIRRAITVTLKRHFEEMGLEPPIPEEQLSWALLAMATGIEMQQRAASGEMPEKLWKNVLGRLLGGSPWGRRSRLGSSVTLDRRPAAYHRPQRY